MCSMLKCAEDICHYVGKYTHTLATVLNSTCQTGNVLDTFVAPHKETIKAE